MQAIGILLLAAAATGDGFGYDKPYVGLKKLFRPHVVQSGPAPPGGPITAGATGCQFGHPGCQGGASCPGAMGGPAGMGAGAGGRRFPNVRSQIFFLGPEGMKIGWQTGGQGGERVYVPALTTPARYNFVQGYIYRLKLADIPSRAGVQLYPTIEVAPSTPATDAYLTHNPIPVQFTPEDFDQVVDGGNFVTKVIYLPDPKFQELAIAGVETLVSTRLEPGVDPIIEADKRGTILLIVRLGAIDLEMPSTGASVGPNTGAAMVPSTTGTVMAPGTPVLPPGAMPPGVVTVPLTPAVPVDTAPVTPVAPAQPAAPVPPAPSPTTPPVETPAAETPAAPVPDAPKF